VGRRPVPSGIAEGVALCPDEVPVTALDVGIIGLGNVGSGALRILGENAGSIERKLGFPIRVAAICSPSVLTRPPAEAAAFPDALRTTDWREVVEDPAIQIVAELVGGTTIAAEIIEAAIAAGKSVVTANKALLAERGVEIHEAAARAGVVLAMEASVAGGIPIHTVLREGIPADRIESLVGILNGTCNYILTEMERRSETFETVLAEAQQLGYAEADPSADVDGYDARSKLALLTALAFGVRVRPDDIHVSGIRRIRAIDFAYAARLDHTVRLIASAERDGDGLLLSVQPALVPRSAILAHVQGSYNAIWVRGAYGEDTFYYGRGAGPRPTGVAVVSDLMRAAREIRSGARGRVSPFAHATLATHAPRSIAERIRPYYLRFRVTDRPGIIAELASVLAAARISIDAVIQVPGEDKADLPFVITLEPTADGRIRDALARMADLDFLVDEPLALPFESGLGDAPATV
jgi:homoserine dehydrogenase